VWGSIKSIGRRIWRRLGKFPVAVKTLFQVLLVVAVTLVLVAGSTSEQAISKLGAFLQLGGFLTVAVGIEKTLQSFGRKPFWERLKEPFDDFWGILTGDTVQLQPDDVQHSHSISTGSITFIPPSDLSLEERVKRVEGNVETLANRMDDLNDRLDEEAERLEEKIGEEIGELGEKMRQLRELVKTANIGDVTLRLEWFGVYLLIFGILLKTFPSTAYTLGHPIATGLLSTFGI
jgi:hypothetical protein